MVKEENIKLDNSSRTHDPEQRDRRQLPAMLRYLTIVVCGSLVAALASYLLRSIGY